MKNIKTYENFPLWISLIAILISILSYIIGAFILSGFGIIFAVLYLLYCLGVEVMVIFRSCGNCYYYGKVCGLGKGKIAPVFCKKGDPKKFVERDISWYHLLPDFLTVIFPMVGGVILAIFNFSWILVGMLLILVVLFFGGTAAVRGSLTCKYCKQREIGCPAEKLFIKEDN